MDMDQFREQVKSEAQDAIDEQLGGGTDDDDADELLGSAEIAARGWDLGEYNAFFADCREAGFDASDCGAMWSSTKDDGSSSGTVSTPDNSDSSDGEMTDVLLLKEGSESSDLAAELLSQKIMDEELGVATVDSDDGQQILENIDPLPPVPAHIRMTESEVEPGDLEGLIQDAVSGV